MLIDCDEQTDGVLWCTLKDGRRANAINPALLDSLDLVLKRVEEKSKLTTVVLSAGDSKHFCGGGDLRFLASLSKNEVNAFSDRVFEICARIERSPTLWCAMLKGAVLGGGAELALAFDVRFAHPDTRFAFSQLQMGLTSGWGGFARLVAAVGRQKALSLVLTGKNVDAEALSELNLAVKMKSTNERGEFASWVSDWCTDDPALLRGAIGVIKRSGDRTIERQTFRSLWQNVPHRKALNTFLKRH